MTPGDEIRGVASASPLALHFLKHPVHHTNVEVDVFIEAGAESVNEGDGTDVQACLVHMGRTGAVGLQSLCDHPQKMRSTMLSTAPSRCMKYRNLLGTESTHWRTGRRGIRDRSGALLSPPCAGWCTRADSPAFAGEGYKVVVPTVAAASAGKAMGKDAALKILGKRFAHEGLGVWWSPWPSN